MDKIGEGWIIHSPLAIERPRSKPYILNLNVYRNTHYRSLNNMKIKYKELILPYLVGLPNFTKIEITYTLYPKTRRLCDVSNVCSVVDKFFCDALVEAGKIKDDNYLHLPNIHYQFGEVDKDSPRVEILIKDISCK